MKSDPTNGSSVTNPDGPMKLIPGQNVTVTIEAKPFNNLTNVWFESGAVYDLKATGTWFDAGRPSGPNGYPDGNFLQNRARSLTRRQSISLSWDEIPRRKFSLRDVVFSFDKVADIGVGEDQLSVFRPEKWVLPC